MNSIKKFISDEAGVTAIEYALLAALIAGGIATAASTLGGTISTYFGTIGAKIK